MAQYTFEVFHWSGSGYNAEYNTSHTAVMDDDDAHYEGSGDTDETVSIDGGAFGSTTGAPYNISMSFTDTNGDPHVEDFTFFNTGGSWYFIPGPESAFTVGATLGSYQSHTTGWDYADVTCFTKGTLIQTNQGQVSVENLSADNLILTKGGSYKPLRLCLRRKLTSWSLYKRPKLRPIRILAGALGMGLPKTDLLVSPQHRMLVRSKAALRMFGESEVLICAKKLTALPGIFVDENCEGVEYFHLVFDQHEIVFANGAQSESFFLGPQAIATLSSEALEELLALFPEVLSPKFRMRPTLPIPNPKRQKYLIERHLKNRQPLLRKAV